ncbi:hypothetical protein H6F89_29555 [Cyanobacteria bacterium FACHB-63]|nr:hypothetical protein [Cyanobacteria bacterium FACHB-63]
MKKQFPSVRHRMILSFSKTQIDHLRSTIPARSRNARIRQALIDAGLIPENPKRKSISA